MKRYLTSLFDRSPDALSTWKYHLWSALILYLTLSTFGWVPRYFYRPFFLLVSYPMHLVFNLHLAFSISYLFGILLRKKSVHFGFLFLVFLILANVSREKYEILGIPLLMNDFTFAQHSELLSAYVNWKNGFLLLGGAILPLLIFNFRRSKKPSLYSRMLKNPKLKVVESRSLVLVALSLPVWHGLIANGNFRIPGTWLRVRAHVPVDSYNGSGDIVAFTLSGYSQRNTVSKYQLRPETAQALATLKSPHSIDPSCRSKVAPDILVVMVESLFDPTQIPAIKFSQDPLAPLRHLGYPETKSFFFVPAYGGETANTEFEFLTGSTHRFFPAGSAQYQHHVLNPANSLARMLGTKNYKSLAIHNYWRKFWRRDEVYPLLGFQEFYGLEDIAKATDVPSYGNKPRDNALASFVPDQMKKNIDRPGFYFVVTMGTHGPYAEYLSKTESRVSLTTDVDIKDSSKTYLSNYASFLADSSDALSNLIGYALGRSKPTVVIYFGDHLPGLPLETYAKSGYLDWMKREVGLPKNENKIVPIHVLNNFGCQIAMPKTIASNCMASHLVAQLYPDLPADEFWKYNREFCKRHPLIYDGIDPTNLSGDMADYASLIYQNIFRWEQSAAR